jgi:hypothetical protein
MQKCTWAETPGHTNVFCAFKRNSRFVAQLLRFDLPILTVFIDKVAEWIRGPTSQGSRLSDGQFNRVAQRLVQTGSDDLR